jgi:hypothetical protein
MDFSLLIKVAAVVVAAGFWLYHKSGESSAPAAAGPLAAPPPIPRRARRTRPGAVAPTQAEPAEAGESAVAATPPRHPGHADLRVTRPARARVRADFRGIAALRRAVIAREVLGPPLSLRPPRR